MPYILALHEFSFAEAATMVAQQQQQQKEQYTRTWRKCCMHNWGINKVP